MKLLSVIIPAYNAVNTIGTVIDSIREQKYFDFELIIIDDGSTDSTAEVIRKYTQIDERIKLLMKPRNEGVSAARNTGLELASGDYIAFVDADDRVDPTMYVKLIAALEKSGCDMAMCRIMYEYPNSENKKEEESFAELEEGILPDFKLQRMVIESSDYFLAGVVRYVFAKNILQGMKFETAVAYREDLLFLSELLKVSRKVYYGDFVGYHYIRNISSAVERYQENMFENLIYIATKVFKDSDQKESPVQDRLYDMKILEAVSLSISNMYRKDAPDRTAGECIKEIERFSMELRKVKVRLSDCGIKYMPLLFLANVRAYWVIHMLYKNKEKSRQKRMYK